MKSLTECATSLSSWLFRLIGRFFPPPYASKVLHTRQLRNRTAYRKINNLLSWKQRSCANCWKPYIFLYMQSYLLYRKMLICCFPPSLSDFQMFDNSFLLSYKVLGLPCAFVSEFLTLNLFLCANLQLFKISPSLFIVISNEMMNIVKDHPLV